MTGWDCDEEYISESSSTCAEKFKEHLKAPSSHDQCNIVGRENQNLTRTIKE